MNICTIVARNYLAHARVLTRTFLESHPTGTVTVLVVDEAIHGVDVPGARFRSIFDIGLDGADVREMSAIYDIQELSTAVKPWLLETLLDEFETEPVFYIDPDIWVMADLTDLDDLARERSIVVTPHTTEPMPRDGGKPDETDINRAGMFNLGFLGLGNTEEARRLLAFWQERLRYDCITDLPAGYFVDQRWMDWVPSLYEHVVVRDTGLNVAYWNLASRPITKDSEGHVLAAGVPLRFLHLSGYSPRTPHLLSKHQGVSPRVRLSEIPFLQELTDEYGKMLLDAGFESCTKESVPFQIAANGVKLDSGMRATLRDEALAGKPIPDVFGDAHAFTAWLAESVPVAPGASQRAPRLVLSVWSKRHDLQSHTDIAAPGGLRIARRWLESRGVVELGLKPDVVQAIVQSIEELESAPIEWMDPQSLTTGVNVAGYFSAELGVGQAARSLVQGLEHAKIPVSTFTYKRTLSRSKAPWVDRQPAGAPYDTTIVCVNADMVEQFVSDVGGSYFEGRRMIGLWFWEATEFPTHLHAAFRWFDEVWVTSEYTANVLRRHAGDTIIRVMPLPVELPEISDEGDIRSDLELPLGLMYLFMFDWLSVPERKNPMGLVRAFQEAFPDASDNACLVIKTINGDKHSAALERLKYEVRDRSDIAIIDGYLDLVDRDRLIAASDVYVSLHRCEGFGLTMAESMALGKPVIATGYSGNMAFMDKDSSFLVPYQLAEVPAGNDPYPVGSHWAEPNLEVAAQLMLELSKDKELGSRIGVRAVEAIKIKASSEALESFLVGTLKLVSGPGKRPEMVFGVSTPIDRVSRYANVGPRIPWEQGRGLRATARRTLRRILRPYETRHNEFARDIADSLAQLEQQAVARELDWNTRLAGLRAEVLEEIKISAKGFEQVVDHVSARPYMSQQLDSLVVGGFDSIGYSGSDDEVETAKSDAYVDFEEIFRGSEELIRGRQLHYVPLVNAGRNVVDLGCGRGEFLDVMRDHGIRAIGVDSNAGMIDRCSQKGHQVVQADVVDYLRSCDDESCSFLFSSQVVEHMTDEVFALYLQECHRVLSSDGGVMVFETVNPYSLRALRAFWVDLSHEKPIFPEVALKYCHAAGFGSAASFFPFGMVGDWETDRLDAGEYAVVASKGEWPVGLLSKTKTSTRQLVQSADVIS